MSGRNENGSLLPHFTDSTWHTHPVTRSHGMAPSRNYRMILLDLSILPKERERLFAEYISISSGGYIKKREKNEPLPIDNHRGASISTVN